MQLLEPVVVGAFIAVPEPWREDLDAWRRSFGDPHADRIPVHITLLEPTRMTGFEFEGFRQRLLHAAADESQFRVELGPTATFRPVSPVVYLQAHAEDDALPRLHSCVREAAGSPPRRHPYLPHLTVAMDVPDEVLDLAQSELADYEAAWVVDRVDVWTRDRAGVWHPAFEAPLASAPDAGSQGHS